MLRFNRATGTIVARRRGLRATHVVDPTDSNAEIRRKALAAINPIVSARNGELSMHVLGRAPLNLALHLGRLGRSPRQNWWLFRVQFLDPGL